MNEISESLNSRHYSRMNSIDDREEIRKLLIGKYNSNLNCFSKPMTKKDADAILAVYDDCEEALLAPGIDDAGYRETAFSTVQYAYGSEEEPLPDETAESVIGHCYFLMDCFRIEENNPELARPVLDFLNSEVNVWSISDEKFLELTGSKVRCELMKDSPELDFDGYLKTVCNDIRKHGLSDDMNECRSENVRNFSRSLSEVLKSLDKESGLRLREILHKNHRKSLPETLDFMAVSFQPGVRTLKKNKGRVQERSM